MPCARWTIGLALVLARRLGSAAPLPRYGTTPATHYTPVPSPHDAKSGIHPSQGSHTPHHTPLSPTPHPSRRRLDETPGITPLTFQQSTVTESNLGGMCGITCPGVNLYDISTGSCEPNYVYEPTTGTCTRDSARYLEFAGVGTTASGVQINLRVANLTEYWPWNANQNGVSGDWGNINVLGNKPCAFEFCFLDAVRR